MASNVSDAAWTKLEKTWHVGNFWKVFYIYKHLVDSSTNCNLRTMNTMQRFVIPGTKLAQSWNVGVGKAIFVPEQLPFCVHWATHILRGYVHAYLMTTPILTLYKANPPPRTYLQTPSATCVFFQYSWPGVRKAMPSSNKATLASSAGASWMCILMSDPEYVVLATLENMGDSSTDDQCMHGALLPFFLGRQNAQYIHQPTPTSILIDQCQIGVASPEGIAGRHLCMGSPTKPPICQQLFHVDLASDWYINDMLWVLRMKNINGSYCYMGGDPTRSPKGT